MSTEDRLKRCVDALESLPRFDVRPRTDRFGLQDDQEVLTGEGNYVRWSDVEFLVRIFQVPE